MEEPILAKILTEVNQTHETRRELYTKLEVKLGRPVISFFTSFQYPVSIEDSDADMIEGILQTLDLTNGLALVINSPGGQGLAAERIINICRSYSGTKEFWVVVPGKAKSAATMVAFGASKIIMGPTSELGPVDPQLSITENGVPKRFSVHNLIKSYQDLFNRAIGATDKNIQPFLQQLANYDERFIEELKAANELAKDISTRTLSTGMLNGTDVDAVKDKIKIFLTPDHTKAHGRPIYRDEAKSCGLVIENMEIGDETWKLCAELYARTNNYVSMKAAKCIESKSQSFVSTIPS